MKRVDNLNQKYLSKVEQRRGRFKFLTVHNNSKIWIFLGKTELIGPIAIAMLFGMAFIISGVVRTSSADVSKKNIRSETEIKQQINDLNADISRLRVEMQDEYSKHATSEKYHELSLEIVRKESDVNDASAELWKVQNGVYEKMKGGVLISNMPMIVTGVLLCLASILGISYQVKRKKISE